MRFESGQSDWELDKERERNLDKPWEKLAIEKADEIIEENAPKLRNFKGLLEYVRDNIDEDREQVEELEKKFEESETEQKAKILEAIILDKGGDWMGPNTEMIKTSRFDDVIGGSDLVLEITEDEKDEEGNHKLNHLSLAVDVTFGSNVVEKKLERIKEEIDADKLRDIKYFRTIKNGVPKRYKLNEVPRVIIGVETSTVDDLSAAWVRGDNEYFGESEAQYALLDEMRSQLETFATYAEQEGHEQIAQKYNEALHFVNRILETKEIPKGESNWLEDRVLKGIKRGLSNLFKVLDSE